MNTRSTLLLSLVIGVNIAGCDSNDAGRSPVGEYALVSIAGRQVPTEELDSGITTRCGGPEAVGFTGGRVLLHDDGVFEVELMIGSFCVADGRVFDELVFDHFNGVYHVIGSEIRLNRTSSVVTGAWTGDDISFIWSTYGIVIFSRN